MKAIVIACLLCVACAWRASARRRAPVRRRGRDVWSTQGRVRGYYDPDPPHYAYLGLPYAATTRRFKAPEPPVKWDGTFEGTHRVKCRQEGTGDQNCLVVNVFAPEHAEKLPVLVFVHDGTYQKGWGSHKPPKKLLSQGLIIVTFNYRLGPLGFLCLMIPGAPGNAGLKDQIAALYWVQRNIANFGGDPSDVTVYGAGSGAAAVQILLLSSLSKGLFHKAILESGSVLSPISLMYEPVVFAFNVAVKLGYNSTEESEKLLKFFRNVPLKQLTNVSNIFLPCVERSNFYSLGLLNEDPIDILRQGNFDEVPMLIAYTYTDGMSVIEKNRENLNTVPEHFDNLLPNNLRFNNDQQKLRIAELVKELYFEENIGNFVQNYANYFHDVLFEFPIMKFGVLYADKSSQPVYIMKFKHGSRYQKEMPIADEKIVDYFYEDEDQDELITNRLTTLFCNFIKLGDPTPITTSVIPVMWNAVSTDSREPPTIKTASLLRFDGSLTMATSHRDQRLGFWDHVYDSFYRTHSFN